MCQESGPGGFYTNIEPPNVNSPLVEPSETGFNSLEPGPVKILPKGDPEELEKFNGVKNACAKSNEREAPHAIAAGKFVKGSGLLVPYQVEDQCCWAIVDTGASNSLISSTLATELGNEIVPNQSSLIGPVGNVMSTRGLMKAMVKIGDLVAEDEFVVVDGLYPEVLMGLKFMIESKIYPNVVSQELVIKKPDRSTVVVPMQLGGRHVPSPGNEAYVFDTIPAPDHVSVATELNDELERDVDEILNLATSDLESAEIKEELQTLIREYRDVFSLPKDPLGTAVGIEHKIDIENSPPIKIPPYKIAPHKLDAIRAEINEMIEKKVIVPSKSPYSSPIVMVPKKDGSNRMCIDYRKLNEVTVKDAYPLPRIGQTIDALQGAGVFSSLDLASGYWQIPVAPEDRHKTAFCTPDGGLYECLKMPFGLTNAPPTFQRYMNDVFKEFLYQFVLIFLDDVLTYSKTPEEHLAHLRKVFQVLRMAGLKLKPKKCNLFQNEVHYLGHVINQKGIQPDPKKLEAIRTWERPKNVTQVRSFTAFCNYYRKFVKNFAEVARPLYLLTSKGTKFTWNDEHEEAFCTLKERLLAGPILAFPNFSLPFVIDTDASETALGAVLSQVVDGTEYPIAFESRVLTKTEVNYATTKREALGVVQAVQWFRPYIYGTKCIIRTDHASLQWLFRQNADGMTFRMIQKLQEYDYKIVHRAGQHHCNADGLSRRPNDVPEWMPGEEEDLRGPIPEFENFDTALLDAEQDVKSARSKKNDANEDDEFVNRHVRLHIHRPPREVVRYKTGEFINAGDALVLCASAEMRVLNLPMITFVCRYSHLRPLPESLNQVGRFLVYRDEEKARYIYVLITRKNEHNVATYDDLKKCLRRMWSHANIHGVSAFAMPRIGCIDDRLEWINVAICLETVFQGMYCTVTVYTPEQDLPLYPNVEPRTSTSRSRDPDTCCATAMPEEMLSTGQVGRRISWTKSDSDLANKQRLDPAMGILFRAMKDAELSLSDSMANLGLNPISKETALSWNCPEALELWSNWESLALENNVLYRRWRPNNRTHEVWQAVVPKEMRKEILYQLHDSPLSGGHFAVEKTLARIKQRFWWPALRSSVEMHVASCLRCAARSTAGKPRRAELHPFEVQAPFKVMAADILGPVTLAKRSLSKYILVMSDLYTKYVVAVPLKDMTATTVATAIVEEWITKFGAPDVIHTDQGTNFNSEMMHDVCKIFMIDKTRTSPYHPQGNGQVERFNRVIADTISKYCAERPQEWDLYLPHVVFVYNTTVHRTTGTTPFSMLFGKEAQYPIDLYYPKPPGDPRLELSEPAAELNEKLYEVHEHAQMTMGKEQRRQKDYYHRKVHGEPFEPGDLVWLLEPHKAKSRKFYLPWQGPYEVLSRTSEVNYRICKKSAPEKWQKVHFNRLKPFVGDTPPRRSERRKKLVVSNYEELPNISEETESEIDGLPFNVFNPTTAESQAARNKPHVTFDDVPKVAEKASDEECPEPNPLYVDISEGSVADQTHVYEEISEGGDPSPRIEEVEASESSSEPCRSRQRKPPVRFGIDDYTSPRK